MIMFTLYIQMFYIDMYLKQCNNKQIAGPYDLQERLLPEFSSPECSEHDFEMQGGESLQKLTTRFAALLV